MEFLPTRSKLLSQTILDIDQSNSTAPKHNDKQINKSIKKKNL